MTASSTRLTDAIEPSRFSLTRRDQTCLVVTLLIAFAALGGNWLYEGGLSNNVGNFDQMVRPTFDFKIDVNTASAPELAMLPEVGETLAKRIIERREKYGPFQATQDLRKVRGIGPKTLENIRPFLLPLPQGE